MFDGVGVLEGAGGFGAAWGAEGRGGLADGEGAGELPAVGEKEMARGARALGLGLLMR